MAVESTPRETLASDRPRFRDGGPSLTLRGASWIGHSPLPVLACPPSRNGTKSTASDVISSPSGVPAPLTGFSGVGGTDDGEIAGPRFAPPPVFRPHQLVVALSGAAVL